MKIQYQRKFIADQKGGNISLPSKLSQREYLRYFSKWLLVIPAAMLILFGCGQLGILASQKLAERSMPLPIGVDYGPWAYVLIHSSLPEHSEAALQDRLWESAPPEEHRDNASIVIIPPQSTVVGLEVSNATNTPPPLSTPSPTLEKKPSPEMTPTVLSEFTSTPTTEVSVLATGSPMQLTPTLSNPEPYKVCDEAGHPLSYDDLHLHTANVESDGFGTIIHALRIDEEETQVILEKLTVKQNHTNPSILEMVSVDWSHWGMGSTKIDVQEAQAEVTITLNHKFYACFAEDKCDHSLYGGEVYIDFDGELSGEYRLFVEVHFPEYGERCKLDLHVNVKP
jgi:hypothetical protein